MNGVVVHRLPHRGDRAHARLQIASSGWPEPRAPRLDERAVARRVPRSAEDAITVGPHGTIAVALEEPNDIDLARLDDDGGSSPTQGPLVTRHDGAYGFSTPMIPGAREPGMLTTFSWPVVNRGDAPVTMDAATIAARQREGGGAPSERRRPRDRSRWRNLTQALRLLVGVDRG